MKKIHVLPGDAMTENFKSANLEGEIAVCRECLIEGDLIAENFDEFWRVRAGFIKKTYGQNERSYFENVASEFHKLKKLEVGTEVNLWFEYELFCQANMWFCLWLLSEKEIEIYRVAPVVRSGKDLWKGFGGLIADELAQCFAQRTKFSEDDIQLGRELWQAFRSRDFDKLRFLSESKSECFPHLKEVCEAAVAMETRPKQTLEEIASEGEADFGEIFAQFAARAGVYGFGDAQVKRIMREI